MTGKRAVLMLYHGLPTAVVDRGTPCHSMHLVPLAISGIRIDCCKFARPSEVPPARTADEMARLKLIMPRRALSRAFIRARFQKKAPGLSLRCMVSFN